jgi:hypothetical protein
MSQVLHRCTRLGPSWDAVVYLRATFRGGGGPPTTGTSTAHKQISQEMAHESDSSATLTRKGVPKAPPFPRCGQKLKREGHLAVQKKRETSNATRVVRRIQQHHMHACARNVRQPSDKKDAHCQSDLYPRPRISRHRGSAPACCTACTPHTDTANTKQTTQLC